MVIKTEEGDRRSVLTLASLVVTGAGNLLAWTTLLWTLMTVPAAALFEYIPLVVVTYLLLLLTIVGFLIALAASWRKEAKGRLLRFAYLASLLSFPLYFLVSVILL